MPLLALKPGARSANAPELTVAFFDNDEDNIKPCEAGVKANPYSIEYDGAVLAVKIDCVDVKECGRRGKTEDATKCHDRLYDKLQKEEQDEGVLKIFDALYEISGNGFFDDSSGVNPDDLEKSYLDRDVWVFDWDKTISQCEGLVAGGHAREPVETAWQDHARAISEQVIARPPDDWLPGDAEDFYDLYVDNPDMVLKAMCGGTSRVEALRSAFEKKRGRDPTAIFVLTANPARGVISKLATTLFEGITDDQVFSTRQYRADARAEVFGEEKPLRGMTKYELIHFQVMNTLKEKRARS